MEIQDAPNEGKTKEEILESYKTSLDSLSPITDTGVVLNICKIYLESCPTKVTEECMLTIGVFLRMFTNMKLSIEGVPLDAKAIENMFMGESMMLELNNSWYNQFKPILTPILAHSKISLLAATRMKEMSVEAPHSSTDDAIWSLIVSSWDFIPWCIFTATGNLNSYIASKEIFMRMIVISKEELTK